MKEKGLTANYLVVTAGSCGTMAGLLLGAKYFQAPFQVIGISCSRTKEEGISKIVDLTSETTRLLEMEITLSPDEIVIYDEYIGEKYGVLTPQCIEAMKIVARTEGILLDPVYTAKAMAGLIDLIRKGRFTAKDTIIFQHTGGAPGVFAYAGELAEELA